MTSFGLHFIEDSKDPEKEGLWLLIMTAKGGDWFKLDPNTNPLVYVKQLEAIKESDPDGVGFTSNLKFNEEKWENSRFCKATQEELELLRQYRR